MRKVLLMIALVACGGDDGNSNDAGGMPDGRPVLTLNCQTYCDTIAAACTGANAQYADAAHCTGTCNAFTPGANASETSGNTLGCRIYHAQNAMLMANAAATHCPHAGPVGSTVDATAGVCGTDPCDDFCALDAKVCGTDAAPVTGVTHRYTDVAACKTACAQFAKTPAYGTTTTSGNNFACRVYHLTNAASSTGMGIDTHCGHTLSPASAQCI